MIQVIYMTTIATGDLTLCSDGINNININLRVLTLVHPYLDMPNVYVSYSIHEWAAMKNNSAL